MTHKHHIIPKHEWKRRFGNLIGINSPDNLVVLTVPQHAEAHKLLYEQFGSWQDDLAHRLLSGAIDIQSAIRERCRLSNMGKLELCCQ